MGVFVPCADTVQVKVYGTRGGRNWANIWHYNYSGVAPGSSGLLTLATTIGEAWVTNIVPLQDETVMVQGVICTDLTSETAGQSEYLVGMGGSRSGGVIGGESAVLINYPVPLRYRGGHPRQYLSAGVTSDLATPVDWNGTFVDAVAAAWPAVWSAPVGSVIGAATIESTGYVQRQKNRVALNPFVFQSTEGVAFTVETELATQRRRVRRAGHRR